MRLSTRSVAQYRVLSLGGTLSAGDAGAVRRQLADLLVGGTDDMVICDLSKVTSADPQALMALVTHHGLDGTPGPVVCVVGARGEVARTLDDVGIRGLLPVAPTVASAVELARSRPPRLSAVRAIEAGSTAPRLARRFAQEVCAAWGLEGIVEDVELVVTELVANAVEHAHTDLVVRLERTTTTVVVAVHDDAGGLFPSWWRGGAGAGPDDADPEWGHGLTIVRALAESAGVVSEPTGGKVVWAALAARLPAPRGAMPRPVRWRLTVNSGGAGRAAARDGRWVVRLDLVVMPDRPELVGLALSSRPRHPSLPRGQWQVARSALHDGLNGPVRHGDVRLWPERDGHELVLELPADPPHVVRVSASRVRQFLTVTAADHQSERTDTTAETASGP